MIGQDETRPWIRSMRRDSNNVRASLRYYFSVLYSVPLGSLFLLVSLFSILTHTHTISNSNNGQRLSQYPHPHAPCRRCGCLCSSLYSCLRKTHRICRLALFPSSNHALLLLLLSHALNTLSKLPCSLDRLSSTTLRDGTTVRSRTHE